ncbi:exodeoxyribonuclease VII large subunit [Candidatus Nomurabacteria bacterium]|nr:exodeoxyribonuclease VII large subunit [Candidatus Nomurabacteria bacterium]
MENQPIQLSVSEFLDLTNQVLYGAFPSVIVEGEVSSFKINQNKYVFFDLKDEHSSIGCFMMLFSLRQPIENGMRVMVVAQPKLTQWGKFSLTVRSIKLVGEGSIKKSMQILHSKLEKEGLFTDERKRPLPLFPERVAIISSKDAAGFKDFVKIADDRWGGLSFVLAHVQVQGAEAPDQIIRALEYFNSQEKLPEVIVILRGGGSADDLSPFNDERLVRSVAASRIPTLTGIGHEVDVSLVDLVADKKASTPSNAAQILIPDRDEVIRHQKLMVGQAIGILDREIVQSIDYVNTQLNEAVNKTLVRISETSGYLASARSLLNVLDPERNLERGYAIVSGNVLQGGKIEIKRKKDIITAEVLDVKGR